MNRSGAVSRREIGVLRATLAAFCAVLVGLGLARFAYTPLIPALIDAQWFTPAQAAYLGAANLAGYLAGALAARPLARSRTRMTPRVAAPSWLSVGSPLMRKRLCEAMRLAAAAPSLPRRSAAEGMIPQAAWGIAGVLVLPDGSLLVDEAAVDPDEPLDGGLDGDLGSGLRLESHLFAALFATEDAKTGMVSFMENGPGKAKFAGR